MQPRERAEVESGNWEEYFEAQEKEIFFFFLVYSEWNTYEKEK